MLLKNEDGAILVIALVLLALLSLLGIAATNTATLEIQIAANDRTYKQNFYMAEAALREAMQRLENSVSDFPSISDPRDTDVRDFMKNGNIIDVSKMDLLKDWLFQDDNHTDSNLSAFTGYAAIGPIGAAGAGNMINGAQTITYIVVGFYKKDEEPNRGEVIVDAGYRLLRFGGGG